MGQGEAMENAKWRGVVKGLALSAVYCLGYLAAWFNSLDQWFLPAGLRVAGLLLLPYRYWPYLFAGDIAALLLLRVPRAGYDGELWAYASPFLLPFLIAIVPAFFRKRYRTLREKIKWLPLMVPFIALWGGLCNMQVNFALSGPSSFASFDKLMRFSVGSWLGIFMIILPFLAWLEKDPSKNLTANFWRGLLISIIFSSGVYLSISLSNNLDPGFRNGLLMLMILPAIGLTVQHGWHGAAIGIFISNLFIAMTLPEFQMEAAYDSATLISQQVLVIAATSLLLLGSAITEQHIRNQQLEDALNLARTSFLSTENTLKEKAVFLTKVHARLENERKQLVDKLKANGDHQSALLVNTEAVQNACEFSAQITDIYPIQIETHGLNAVLNSQGFIDNRGGMQVLPLLGSNPKLLTLELQQVAYRCVCNAFDLLSECAPSSYVLKTRVRHTGRRRGIALFVTAKPTSPLQSTHKSTAAAHELAARVKAHGGIVKRHHAHRISLWLSEPIES